MDLKIQWKIKWQFVKVDDGRGQSHWPPEAVPASGRVRSFESKYGFTVSELC